MDFKGIWDRTVARLGIVEAEYLIEGMALVPPRITGVSFWIRIRQKPDTKHREPCIEVRMQDGRFKEDKKNNSVVSIKTCKVIVGKDLNANTLMQVGSILDRCRPMLIAYWEGEELDTPAVIDAMRPVIM